MPATVVGIAAVFVASIAVLGCGREPTSALDDEPIPFLVMQVADAPAQALTFDADGLALVGALTIEVTLGDRGAAASPQEIPSDVVVEAESELTVSGQYTGVSWMASPQIAGAELLPVSEAALPIGVAATTVAGDAFVVGPIRDDVADCLGPMPCRLRYRLRLALADISGVPGAVIGTDDVEWSAAVEITGRGGEGVDPSVALRFGGDEASPP